jgi:hypothetical protein
LSGQEVARVHRHPHRIGDIAVAHQEGALGRFDQPVDVAAPAAAPQASIPTGGLPGSAISQKPSPPIPFMWG